jgi:hypothetical protein
MQHNDTRSAAPVPSPQPAFFEDPTIDHLVAATLELGAELWVQRERLRAVEALLARHGVVTAEMIEQWQPSEEEQRRAQAERDAFIERVYGLFARRTVRATPEG